MTITYRDTKGSDLTPAEVDANFRHVLDSSNQSFLQSGTGANAETVLAALRRVIAEAQFDSEAEFDAALEAAVLANNSDIGFGVRNIRIATDTVQAFVFGDITFSSNVDNSGLTIQGAGDSDILKFNMFRTDVFSGVGIVGQIGFEGKYDNGTTTIYSAIRGIQLDPNNADPEGGIRFYTINGSSTLTERVSIDADGDLQLATGFVSAPTKVVGHSFGAATSNSTCLNLAAASTSRSTIRAPHGTAPTSPVDGDVWTTSSGLYVRINGATVGPLVGQSAGDWTPTYTTSGTDFDSVTYDAATAGRYIRTGNAVTLTGFIRTDALTAGSATGSVLIGNLPFAAGSGNKFYAAVAIASVTGFGGDFPINARVTAGGSTIELFYRDASDTTDNALAITDLGTGANANTLTFSVTYFTA